jgi:hypothetical protein
MKILNKINNISRNLGNTRILKKNKNIKYQIRSKFNQLHRKFWVLSAATKKTIVFLVVRSCGLAGSTNNSQVTTVSILDPEAGVSRFL